MKTLPRCAWSGGLLVACALLGNTPVQSNPDDPAVPDGVEVQVRGPVHEAFAQPNDPQAGPGQVVPKQPPAPIPEEPPEERPEGANVQFIPGYWAWDPESNQFMWVSGTYRNAPVGRQWVPGHWDRAAEGWRWVAGYWAGDQQQEPRYTPEPPAPLDNDPNVAPPGDDFNWVPGAWMYRDTRFVWRPGYWSPFRAGRVWVSPRYYWTPSGYLFNDGYWDYPFEARGVLFAPVVFNRPYWNTPGWCWRPSFVVSFGCLFDSCFVRSGGFYFGNYYGAGCVGYGYRPWFHGHGRYHAAFAYHRWHNHHPHDWHARQHQIYADRGAGRLAGPPRTFAQQTALMNDKKGGNNTRVVAPLNQAKLVNTNVQMVKQSSAQLEMQKSTANRTRELAANRAKGVEGARLTDGTLPRSTTAGTPNFATQPKFTAPAGTKTDGPRGSDFKAPALTTLPKGAGSSLNSSPPAPKTFSAPPPSTNLPKSITPPPTKSPGSSSPPPRKSGMSESFAPSVVEGPRLRSIDPSPNRGTYSSGPSTVGRSDWDRRSTSPPSYSKGSSNASAPRWASSPSQGGSYSSAPASPPRYSAPASNRSSISSGGDRGGRSSNGSSSGSRSGGSSSRSGGKSK